MAANHSNCSCFFVTAVSGCRLCPTPLAYLNIRIENVGALWLAWCVFGACFTFINGLVALNEALVLPQWLAPLEQWMKTMEESAKQLTEQFLSVSTWQGLFVNLLIMAALPAIGEELLFEACCNACFPKMGCVYRHLADGYFVQCHTFAILWIYSAYDLGAAFAICCFGRVVFGCLFLRIL